MADEQLFQTYTFHVDISVRRPKTEYTTEDLTKVSVDVMVPLTDDTAARDKLIELVTDELERAADVIDARTQFAQRSVIEDTESEVASS